MARVDITPSAAKDLIDIWKYIAQDSPSAADRVIDRIYEQMQKLAEMPRIGHTRREIDRVYRIWSVYSYLIVYRPDVRPIQIIRVVHGRRDLNQLPLPYPKQ